MIHALSEEWNSQSDKVKTQPDEGWWVERDEVTESNPARNAAEPTREIIDFPSDQLVDASHTTQCVLLRPEMRTDTGDCRRLPNPECDVTASRPAANNISNLAWKSNRCTLFSTHSHPTAAQLVITMKAISSHSGVLCCNCKMTRTITYTQYTAVHTYCTKSSKEGTPAILIIVLAPSSAAAIRVDQHYLLSKLEARPGQEIGECNKCTHNAPNDLEQCSESNIADVLQERHFWSF